MAVVLALLSAVTYGTADYFGGLATRRAAVVAVLMTTQTVGLVILVLALPLAGGTWVGHDVALGAAGGVAGCFGLLCFYRSLAIGPMSLAAPVSAVIGALVPVSVGLATGERPGTVALIGLPFALGAIVLFSRPGDEHEAGDASTPPVRAGRLGVIPLALAAGLGFGLIFLAFGKVGEDSGIWPVVVARAVSVAMVAAAVIGTRSSVRLDPAARRVALPAGVFDASANVLVLFANRYGLVTVVSVLASLYPATTVVLAQMFLHERFTRVHAVGAGLAAVAVVLVALG